MFVYFDRYHVDPLTIFAENAHYILHTSLFKNLLPHVVFIAPEFVIKISAIDITFSLARKAFVTILIS